MLYSSNKERGSTFMSEGKENETVPYDILIMPEGVHVITSSFSIYNNMMFKRGIKLQVVKDLLDSVIPFSKLNLSRVNALDLDHMSLKVSSPFIIYKNGKYFYDYLDEKQEGWVYLETIINAIFDRYPEDCMSFRDYYQKHTD